MTGVQTCALPILDRGRREIIATVAPALLVGRDRAAGGTGVEQLLLNRKGMAAAAFELRLGNKAHTGGTEPVERQGRRQPTAAAALVFPSRRGDPAFGTQAEQTVGWGGHDRSSFRSLLFTYENDSFVFALLFRGQLWRQR